MLCRAPHTTPIRAVRGYAWGIGELERGIDFERVRSYPVDCMPRCRTIRLVVLFLVLACSAGCDQATKHLARRELSQTGSVTLPGSFIQFTLADNPGAFLSLGASLPQETRSALVVGLGVGLALLLVYLLRTRSLGWHGFLGLALIWAGGVSNLGDRLFRHGLVTDFIILRAGPLHTGIFNLADFAVLVGALLLVAALRPGVPSGEGQPTQDGAKG
jgi:signal peptidase II